MINGLQIGLGTNQDGKEMVSVQYDDYFDRSTGERDYFSAEFDLERYLLGLRELQDKGRSSIDGQFSSLSLEGKSSLCMTMETSGYAISVPVNFKDLCKAVNTVLD
ncbi:MAG: hypothetical protein WAU65_03095 [Candidatus Nanoarchaeia archaeon]